MSLTRLARRKSFQCMHRYALEGWTEAENRAEFGACFTPTGHGHNYELEAYFEGKVDPNTGMIANLAEIDKLMGEVVTPLDGKHLNFDVAAFAKRVPTTEALAEYLAGELIVKMKMKLAPGVRLAKVRLYEYEDLWVDVWP
jgi:6-pyruvoyltetrahydropterin/6-carboxytetrahydropterin synthase